MSWKLGSFCPEYRQQLAWIFFLMQIHHCADFKSSFQTHDPWSNQMQFCFLESLGLVFLQYFLYLDIADVFILLLKSGLRGSQFFAPSDQRTGWRHTDFKTAAKFCWKGEESVSGRKHCKREWWALTRWQRSPDLCLKSSLQNMRSSSRKNLGGFCRRGRVSDRFDWQGLFKEHGIQFMHLCWFLGFYCMHEMWPIFIRS
jgi:hypothetical protein